jgi:DNA-binding transcriptional ArsR family regulator
MIKASKQTARDVKIDQARIERAAEVLKTVAHPLRLRIVELLSRARRATQLKICSRQPAADPQHLTQMRGVPPPRRRTGLLLDREPGRGHVIHRIRRS